MYARNQLRAFFQSQKEIIKTGIDLAEANIGHGRNKEKKAYVIAFLLAMVHIPCDIPVGAYRFDVVKNLTEIADDVIQLVFDKLKQTAE